MLNAGWIGRNLASPRVMVFGDTAPAHAMAGRRSRHEISFLRAGPPGADGIIIDAGEENASLAEAQRTAATLAPGRVIGVVVDSWTGFSAALALDASLPTVRVRPLCAGAQRARRALVQHRWSHLAYADGPSTVVIQGSGLQAEHLVIALFRSMHGLGQAPQVVVTGNGAADFVAGLLRRMPQLAQIGTLSAAASLADVAQVCAIYAVSGSAPARPAAIPLYWFGDDAPAGAIVVAPFDWRQARHELFTDPHEHLAQAIHNFYFEQALRDGNQPGSRPSMMPWESLPERFRQASRYQADHLAYKLEMAGARQRRGRDSKFRFNNSEVEALARVEHARWSAVQLLDGWRYGETRDDAQRITPFLKPYDALAPEIQDRDRMPVRQIPAQLARIGQGVARDVAITLGIEAGAQPGWGFGAGFAGLLREIAAQYPGRNLMLATSLATEFEQRAAKIAMAKKRALLCLLLPSQDLPPEMNPFLSRAARLLVTGGQTFEGELHIHVGDTAPAGQRRLIHMTPGGRIEDAPWF